MPNSSDLSIIIPTFNEMSTISDVAKDLTEHFPDAEIIFVNDASTDESYEILKSIASNHIKILNNKFNRGYGYSIKRGIKKSTRKYIAWFDSDGEHKASDLHKMYNLIIEKKLSIIFGRRNASVSLFRSLGKMFIKLIIRLIFNNTVKDYNCGLRIFESSLIKKYSSLLPNGYSASMTSTLIYLYNKFPYYELDIEISKRKFGKSNVRFMDGIKVIYTIVRTLTLFNAAIFYSKIGFSIIFIGLFYSLYKAFINLGGIPIFGAIVIQFGLLVIFFGLIVDHISALRMAIIEEKYDE